MQTIDIVSVLQDIVSQVDGLTLTHGTRFEQNKEADNAIFPKVYLDEPLISRETISGVNNKTVYPVKLFFADKANLDATPAQQRVTILQMREYAREFITRVQQYVYPSTGSKAFDITNGAQITLTDVVNLPYDVGLTGVLLEMDLPIINYQSNCIV